MHMFVCTVPVGRRRVTTDNGECLQRRGRLYAGLVIRLAQCTQAKQAICTVWAVFRHVRILFMPIKFFLPCGVMYTISEPRSSVILSHEGQRLHINLFDQEQG